MYPVDGTVMSMAMKSSNLNGGPASLANFSRVCLYAVGMKNITTAIAEQKAIVVEANVCDGNELKKKVHLENIGLLTQKKKIPLASSSILQEIFCSLYHTGETAKT